MQIGSSAFNYRNTGDAPSGWPRGLILLIDSNEKLNAYRARFTRAVGYETHLTQNLTDAYEMISSGEYSVIVVGDDFPDDTNFAFCKAASKQTMAYIICYVKAENHKDREKAMNCGADYALHKSGPMDELLGYVEVAHRRLNRL